MAKPLQVYLPYLQFIYQGSALSGGKVFFYSPGTTTKINTYPTSADALAGTNANPNPVILDSEGIPSNSGSRIDIYTTQAYKMVVAPSTDSDPPVASIRTVDNVTTLGQLMSTSAKSSNYTVTTSDRDKVISMDASGGARTFTLPAASSAGDGFVIYLRKSDNSANAVTITPNGSDTIDNASSASLTAQFSYKGLISNGTGWQTISHGTSTFASLTVTGNATIGGTLGVTGATTLSSTLDVTGAIVGSSTVKGGNLRLNSQTLEATSGGINITPAGGSAVLIDGAWSIDGAVSSYTGTHTTTGQENVDNLRLDGNTISTTNSNGDLILSPNGTGQVLLPTQCGFQAATTTLSNVTGDGTAYLIIMTSEAMDRGSNFNQGTGTFTAPDTGLYLFSCNLELTGIGAGHVGDVHFQVAGSNYPVFGGTFIDFDNSGTVKISGSCLISMSATQTAVIYAEISGGAKTVDITSSSIWGGCFIG